MNNGVLDILMVEDTPTDAALLKRFLTWASIGARVEWVQSIADAAEAIHNKKYDIALTDLGLPDSTGTDTVIQLRKLSDALPIIALTSLDDDGVGQATIQAGANDYIPKSVLSGPIISRAIDNTLERFQMQRNLVDANRMLQSKNDRLSRMYKMSQQFVDNVSHEFRTPLTVIREFAAIVRDGIDGPVTDNQKSRLSTLINRTDDLANMVDDLLDTSRLEAGLLKTCRETHPLLDIVNQVQSMLQTRANSKRIRLQIHDLPANLSVFCDEEKLRRVLINLIVNAIKFTPVEGQIDISASMASSDRVRITVADNGPGIATDELNAIFERFKQVGTYQRMASCKGFGLGLSIARALASLNLGSLEVNSVEGQGSQFSVLVPVAQLDAVLNCYFDQQSQAGDQHEEISVLEVHLDRFATEANEETIETLDEFLRSSVSSFDLVIKPQENRWLIFTNSAKSNLVEFTNRLSHHWEKLRRNHYGQSLPDLNLVHKTTVNISDGRQELKALAQPKPQPMREPHVEPHIKPRRTGRILVVDDEIDVATAIRSRLQANGFAVSIAHDGISGLEAIDRVRPDAVILDIRMPKMDGLTVLQNVRSNPKTASTPVVVLSANLNDMTKVLDQGASVFVQKPFQSKSLLAALQSVMVESKTKASKCNHA